MLNLGLLRGYGISCPFSISLLIHFLKSCRLILLKYHLVFLIPCLRTCSDSSPVVENNSKALMKLVVDLPQFGLGPPVLSSPSETFQIQPNWFVLCLFSIYFPISAFLWIFFGKGFESDSLSLISTRSVFRPRRVGLGPKPNCEGHTGWNVGEFCDIIKCHYFS